MLPATPPPAAKSAPLSWPLKIWFGLIALCIIGEFALMLIGLLVYRDTDSYTLAGNPWDPSSFPWHVIWSMRLLTILAGLVGVPFATYVVAVPIRLLLGKLLGPDALQKPIVGALIYGLAAVVFFLLAARVMGWFGLGAVPQS